MNHETPTADVGVVIGRFQVHELHEGHRSLLHRVSEKHRKVIVILGMAPLVNTTSNPLDYESRRQMIQSEYPSAVITYVKDHADDKVWSACVDAAVRNLLTPNQTALIYGSRDSFIGHYSGSFHTYELDAEGMFSGSTMRQDLGINVPDVAMWRAGVIWASRNRFPTSYQAVDIALFRGDIRLDSVEMLLGRKTGETLWRLPGGFADPGSESLEDDAARELQEETCVKAKRMYYIASMRIEDWRYRGEPDCIKTALFGTYAAEGSPEAEAADDLAEVQWFPIAKLDPTTGDNIVAKLHRPLVTKALLWAKGHHV